MFSFESAEFHYEPYPIGLVSSVLPDELYASLLDSFPPRELFHYLPQAGRKYVLSEKFNARKYRTFIDDNPHWKQLRDWIKSRDFVKTIDELLQKHHIEMGLGRAHMAMHGAWAWRLGELVKGRWPHGDDVLQTRFEFSMLPADGGYVIPHTDTPRKIITLVVFMVNEEGWDESWGGGVEVGRAKNDRCAFNWLNEQIPFEEVEAVRAFQFKPNQCVVFVKTFNSLHSVRAMTGPEGAMRRSITVNIMRPE